MSKYNAKKVTEDGITFDSRMEHARYRQLMVLAAGGVIYDLTVHPTFELEAKTTVNGKKLRAIKHEADFSYYVEGQAQTLIVEDCKGVETAIWRLKYNLFQRRYPHIEYRVIKDV